MWGGLGEPAGGGGGVRLAEVWALELLGQQLAEAFGHSVFAAAQSQTVHLHKNRENTLAARRTWSPSQSWINQQQTGHLCLCVGLQSQQAADLLALGLNHSSTHIVLWVGINVVQQGRSQSQELHTNMSTECHKGAMMQPVMLCRGMNCYR